MCHALRLPLLLGFAQTHWGRCKIIRAALNLTDF